MRKNLYKEIAKEMIDLLEAKEFEEPSFQSLIFEEFEEKYDPDQPQIVAYLDFYCPDQIIENKLPYIDGMKHSWLNDYKTLAIYVELDLASLDEVTPWEYNEKMLRILADYQKFIYELMEYDDYLEGDEK